MCVCMYLYMRMSLSRTMAAVTHGYILKGAVPTQDPQGKNK